MIKQILLVLLGLFFLINGVNHFYNTHILREYARRRGLIKPKVMIRLSGVLLLAGGVSLITGWWLQAGIAGLCLFLAISAVAIHQFWAETDREQMMIEFMHFIKNWAILFELLYIATTLSD